MQFEDDDVPILDGRTEDFKEAEDRVEEPKNFEVPSTSTETSFRTFQSSDMWFKSPLLTTVPDAIRNTMVSHQTLAMEFFGDLCGLSELEKAKVWSLRAAA